ncbi:MAG: hypothetical protein NTY35_10580 [Planctomycetota bacterium]|nr:hypothetical protein [Planctomycetota bacterium]
MRIAPSCLALAALLASGCTAPSTASLPLISRMRPYPPVEGLEKPELAARARGAVLSASGEKPIAITFLATGSGRDHPIRGEVVALAGPTPDGRFVYAVRDERPGLALRRADVRGADMPVVRCARPIEALAVSPDAEWVALLAPFEAGDARSRGGVLRELVLVSLNSGDVRACGVACWKATPAWIDRTFLACVVAREDGARSIAIVDRADPASVRVLGPGDLVLADPGGQAVIAFRRGEDRLDAVRLPLDGGAEQPLAFRGGIQPLACLGDGLVVSFSAPTLGIEPQFEFDLFGPQIALATIKLHDLGTGGFHTLDARASPRRLWSAGRMEP